MVDVSLLYVCARCIAYTLPVIIVVWGTLVDVPVDVTACVSETVRFNCSTDTNKQLNWQFGKRPDQLVDVYRADEGFAKSYAKTNRHSVDNSISGRCDLIIKNITRDDEGFYVCSETASLGDPPKAKLTVTGAECEDDSCLKDSVAQSGHDVKYEFVTCKLTPYYIDHYPVGKSQAFAIWNEDRLVDDYASSGRFMVDESNGYGKLSIKNVQVDDAGTFRCSENARLNERHKKELIVATSSDCDRNYEITSTLNPRKQGDCYEVTLVGHRDPLGLWKTSRCNGTSCFLSNVTLDSCEYVQILCTIIEAKSETTLVLRCQNEDETCKAQQPKKPEQNQSWLIVVIVIVIVLVFITSVIIGIICRRRKASTTNRRRSTTQEIDSLHADKRDSKTT